MFVRTVILCLCIAPHSLLLAQIEDSNNSEKDYIKFKGTLDKELIELANDTSRQGTNVLHPVLLPEWFFNQIIPRGLPRGFLIFSPEFQGRCHLSTDR